MYHSRKNHTPKGLHLVATPQVIDDKALTLAHQRSPQQNLRKIWKTSKESLKERKLNQIGIKIMTKLWEDKKEKHEWRLKETYLNC